MTMLDQEALDVLREVMDDEFESLVHLYVRDSDSRFPLMREALQQGQLEELRHIVHSFKGASSNICAPDLAADAQVVEDAARTGNTDGLSARIDSLEQAYNDVRTVLIALLS